MKFSIVAVVLCAVLPSVSHALSTDEIRVLDYYIAQHDGFPNEKREQLLKLSSLTSANDQLRGYAWHNQATDKDVIPGLIDLSAQIPESFVDKYINTDAPITPSKTNTDEPQTTNSQIKPPENGETVESKTLKEEHHLLLENQKQTDSNGEAIKLTRKAVNENSEDITDNHREIEKNKNGIEQNHDAIDRTRTVVEENGEDIAHNQHEIDKNQKGIELDHVAISRTRSVVEENREDIAQNSSEIELDHSGIKHNQLQINKNQIAIDRANGLIKQQAGTLDQHEKAITQNRRDISVNEASIHAVDAEVRNTQAQVTNNTGQLNKLNSNFSGLKSEVDEHKREASAGISGALAQANIPQVIQGQRFAVGAGVGGYDGENALAVGVSARMTQNVIVKASVSDDSQQNVGYGAGVSVGW